MSHLPRFPWFSRAFARISVWTVVCLCLVTASLVAACGDDSTPAGDAGFDATTVDGGNLCRSASDCDDGRFCDGVERCAPGASDADERGCGPATEPACAAAETCVEAMDVCNTACVDADGDGEQAPPCGADCDDADAARYPAATEVCDSTGVDEDCDSSTLGADADRDGFESSACCNATAAGLVCGADCDDGAATISPTSVESCNGVDDDCDGTIDDGLLPPTWYADCDGDTHGAPSADTVVACTEPDVPPASCGGTASARWSRASKPAMAGHSGM